MWGQITLTRIHEDASVAPWANWGQTAIFRQSAPENHVSPQFAAGTVFGTVMVTSC
jgi:hypothetical protein